MNLCAPVHKLPPLLFSRVTVPAMPTVSLCCWSDHGRGGRWRCLRPPQPSTSLTMTESTRLWGSTLLPSASSRRGLDGSTPPTPTKKSARMKPALDTSAPLWGSGDGDVMWCEGWGVYLIGWSDLFETIVWTAPALIAFNNIHKSVQTLSKSQIVAIVTSSSKREGWVDWVSRDVEG